MKNSVCVWLLLLATLFVASCKEEESVGDIAGVSQSTWTTGVTLEAGETSAEYTFTAAGAWTASSKESWCQVTPSGSAGASVLRLTLQPNTSSTQRTTVVSIAFTDGYKGDSFVVYQQGTDSGDDGPSGGTDLNQAFYAVLSERYLWNQEFRDLVSENESLLNLPYNSDDDNFFMRSLTRLGQQGVNRLDYKNGHLYSYVTRMPAGASSYATTRAAGEIDHGIEKERSLSLGLVSLAVVNIPNTRNEIGVEIAAVYPDSPAAQAGLGRGDIVARVNGQSFTMDNYNDLGMELWFPSTASTFNLELSDGRKVSLTASAIYLNPVLMHTVYSVDGTSIGYLNYASFDAAYDNELLAAVRDLKSQGIDELILDLRYNGGGHVMSANMLSTLIAGSQADGKVFSYYRYNDERMADVEGTLEYTHLTYDERVKKFAEYFYYGDYNYDGAKLSASGLNLSRVYVLTTGNTASASELVINSLRGIGIDVETVGETSNGKNVGMEGASVSSGGYEYEMFPITFQSYNAADHSISEYGVEPDFPREDWDDAYVPFGPDEPLIAAAIADITGTSAPTTVATKAAAGRRMQAIDLPQSLRAKRLHGMIVLPRNAGDDDAR